MFILLLGNQDSGKIYPCVRFIHGSSHLSSHSCMFTNVLPGSLLISPFFFFCDVCMPMHVCACMRTCVADNFRCLRHLLSILLDVLLKLEVFSSVRLAGQEVSWIPPISGWDYRPGPLCLAFSHVLGNLSSGSSCTCMASTLLKPIFSVPCT